MAPNIAVVINKRRTLLADPDRHAYFQALTQQWLELLPSGEVFNFDHYLHNRLGTATESTPIFYPRLIAEDLGYLGGKSKGEFVEISTNWPPRSLTWDSLAAQALNTYVTARFYWNANQDIEALLTEYYDLYYGPASQQMRRLHEYSERHFPSLLHEPELLLTMRAMAEDALTAAGESTAYGRRISRLLGLVNARYLGAKTEIDSCRTLDSPSTTYRLTQDVTAPHTCFPVAASGITLDCQGHTITFSTGREGGGNAVHADARKSKRGHYLTIRNCTIQDGSHAEGETPSAAIELRGVNQGVTENARINTTGTGILVMGGIQNVFRGNTVNAYSNALVARYGSHSRPQPESFNTYERNCFASRDGYGAYLYQGGEDTVRDNTFTSLKSHGLRLFRPTGTKLIRNTIASESAKGLRIEQAARTALIENAVIDH